jgi:hypothetical protein
LILVAGIARIFIMWSRRKISQATIEHNNSLPETKSAHHRFNKVPNEKDF